MVLQRCRRCEGLNPFSDARCLHCDARLPVAAARVAVGAAFAVTLMACYGGPPRDLPEASSAEPEASSAQPSPSPSASAK